MATNAAQVILDEMSNTELAEGLLSLADDFERMSVNHPQEFLFQLKVLVLREAAHRLTLRTEWKGNDND